MADFSFSSLLNEIETEYTLEKLLKQSPRGSVTLLRCKRDGQRVICRRFTGDGSVYRALQDADTPHLPRIFQVAEQDGETLVLEQYIEGDTLYYLLQGGTLDETAAADILCQLCDGLSVLHALGAIHRDIKPENVVITGNTAVLIDFDAARVVKPENDTDTQVLGTTGYAAPEQYGLSQTDARSDIYSLGVLLNVMLTGRHPATNLTKGPLRFIVETCTAVSADRRYSNTEALSDAIQHPRAKRLRPALWAVLLLVVAGLILLIAKIAVPDTETGFCSFSYDLDGDGTEESYVFGVISSFNPGGSTPSPYARDIFTLSSYEISSRSAAPAVWCNTEEGLIPVPEMAALLEAPSVELLCAGQTGSDVPIVTGSAPIAGVWAPAVTAYFTPETAGLWVFHVRATLDGTSLEATGTAEQLTQEEFNRRFGA